MTAVWPSYAMVICTWQGISLTGLNVTILKNIYTGLRIYIYIPVIYSFHISMKHCYLIKNIQILLRGQNEMQ